MIEFIFNNSIKVLKLIIEGIPSAIGKSIKKSIINRQNEIKLTTISKKKTNINQNNNRHSSILDNIHFKLFVFILILILIGKYIFD